MTGAGPSEFRMPSLGADMESGTVAEWLVQPGDSIRKGDIIAVIDTDKALIEVESFHTGVVDSLLVSAGERVPVGTPLALVTTAPAPARPSTRERPPAPAGKEHPRPAPGAPEPAPAPPSPPVTSPIVRHLAEQRGLDLASVHGTGPAGRVIRADVERAQARAKASPLARKLARELGVDLARITGTGRTGAIRADDVRAAAVRQGKPREAAVRASARPAAPAAAERPAQERRGEAMRQAIAQAMARSKREIPHYYLATTVDMSAALAWLRQRNRDLPVPQRLLPAALLLKATALAAKEVPRLNGFWIDDAFVPGDAVHLGVAISLKGGGLITPALHAAAGRELGDLMAGLKDLVARSRAGRLRATEMTEATITVTNLGDLGVELVHGIVHPPQVALVGFGKILDRPWAVDGLLGVRPLVTVTLAADHRATDGFTGARFLAVVERLLNHPEEL
ncbi:dihydrolipoamide acetyltransferase family protein [Nonomuraea cavernae]|uniref:Dihydrolipoamide acetyltransferase component of pyruvate dehydrogenase complex n=1 Tax=Nonomuraea cavernae TaxID=2045107 RepID=A0A918DR82_9ACTN|nr:dihydrolipoamide acetyltransferase family protein [Nonomuraea cavernae]MCA2187184.1 2-oxo acid dehydrogenase subunit E2 [Nonomuraea cavernae]GGO79015.1 dihydrolipoamide acetyltransferase component of pyruvate dehydrogenase complex [Nonomuraea cavernae]